MPNNDDTCTIGYDQRFLFGDQRRYPPLAYKISKVSPSLVGDIVTFTMTQEQFSASLDNAELMIGGYYASTITPELPELEETPTTSEFEIAYSGKPAVRAGGGYKKVTLKTRIDGKLVDTTEEVEWSVESSDFDVSKLTHSADGNTIKIKCTNDYSLIGKTFIINAKVKNKSTRLVMEVISL